MYNDIILIDIYKKNEIFKFLKSKYQKKISYNVYSKKLFVIYKCFTHILILNL